LQLVERSQAYTVNSLLKPTALTPTTPTKQLPNDFSQVKPERKRSTTPFMTQVMQKILVKSPSRLPASTISQRQLMTPSKSTKTTTSFSAMFRDY
jgi:hypothetical protein